MAFVDREEISNDLKERALAAAGEGITIADARLPDMPLIFVNPAFEQVTGYSREEAIGYNCRFLQGPDTDPKAAETIRTAIREQLDVTARRLAEDRLAAAYRDMQRDLEAAAQIQQSLLPGSIPEIAGFDIAWSYRPSKELGGDTLNIIRLDDTTVALYLIDVSGHGVPASLLSFTLAHTLSSFPEQSFLFDINGKKQRPANPSTVATRLNQRFQLDLGAPQYFTMFYALIDKQNKLLRCIVVGHPPIVVVRSDGSSELLYANGPPIGVTNNIII
jgi:phosphoserine phosphatase RsbU/P